MGYEMGGSVQPKPKRLELIAGRRRSEATQGSEPQSGSRYVPVAGEALRAKLASLAEEVEGGLVVACRDGSFHKDETPAMKQLSNDASRHFDKSSSAGTMSEEIGGRMLASFCQSRSG